MTALAFVGVGDTSCGVVLVAINHSVCIKVIFIIMIGVSIQLYLCSFPLHVESDCLVLLLLLSPRGLRLPIWTRIHFLFVRIGVTCIALLNIHEVMYTCRYVFIDIVPL